MSAAWHPNNDGIGACQKTREVGEKLVEVVEGLLVCVGSIWFGGIETFQDIWRLGIVQKSFNLLFCIFFSCDFLNPSVVPKCNYTKNSKGFERRSFRVCLTIKNHWFFKIPTGVYWLNHCRLLLFKTTVWKYL